MFGLFSKYAPFTKSVLGLLKGHQRDSLPPEECANCLPTCCAYPGFAILENVLIIFDLYKQGMLKRVGYNFPHSLTFKEFTFKYFDVFLHSEESEHEEELMCFHPRCLGPDGNPIAIPREGYYWDTRIKYFEDHPATNCGCIFLSEPLPFLNEKEQRRKPQCILHTKDYRTHVTAKPIDCVFFACGRSGQSLVPTIQMSSRWFVAIMHSFPHSRMRFEALVPPLGRNTGV